MHYSLGTETCLTHIKLMFKTKNCNVNENSSENYIRI